MTKLREIVGFLDEYLKINEINDKSWNGLQVQGKDDVNRIAFAVDAGIDTFERAIEEDADMVIVHHGNFWRGSNPSIHGWNKKRIDLLYKNGISLYAAHLPLDRHEEVGNNAQLLKILNAKIKKEFLFEDGKNTSWVGEFKQPMTVNDIEAGLNAKINAKCVTLPFGKVMNKTIAVCSGGGGYEGFFEALKEKVDVYLTGDAVEVYTTAKDAKINVIFAGHYATETVGVKALSKVLKEKFKLNTTFIDIPTGL